jgi:hypothetical protein
MVNFKHPFGKENELVWLHPAPFVYPTFKNGFKFHSHPNYDISQEAVLYRTARANANAVFTKQKDNIANKYEVDNPMCIEFNTFHVKLDEDSYWINGSGIDKPYVLISFHQIQNELKNDPANSYLKRQIKGASPVYVTCTLYNSMVIETLAIALLKDDGYALLSPLINKELENYYAEFLVDVLHEVNGTNHTFNKPF